MGAPRKTGSGSRASGSSRSRLSRKKHTEEESDAAVRVTGDDAGDSARIDEKKERRKSARARDSISSAIEEAEYELLPDSANEWSRGKRGGILALSLHGVVYASIMMLLGGINLLSILFSSSKFPWALYIVVIWGSFLLMHYGVTWSIFKIAGTGTKELDRFALGVLKAVSGIAAKFAGLFVKGFNPFPNNSRLGRLYDYLLLGHHDFDREENDWN